MSQQTNAVTISEPVYYHREFANDVGEPSEEHSWIDGCKRVGTVALPFFSLYKPLSLPLSLSMGGLRTVNSVVCLATAIQEGSAGAIGYAILQTLISTVALAGTVFAHPVGMLVTTCDDLVIELIKLIQNLYVGEYQDAIENCLSIVNNALYLALFLDGGLEMAIASLAVQILNGLYHSISEFQNDKWLEGVGHLLMATIRGDQLSAQVKTLQMKWEMEGLISKASRSRARNLKTLGLIGFSVFAYEPTNAVEKASATGSAKISAVDQELVDILIKYGNNPKNYSPIAWATHLGHDEIVKKLISNGVDFKQACAPGIGSLLDIALINKNFALAEFFVKNDLKRCNPMLFFKEEDCLQTWEFLEKHQLLKNCKTINWLATCLQNGGSVSGIKFLVEHGADCRSKVNMPPYSTHIKQEKDLPGILTVVRDCGKFQPDFIKFLVAHGAPINTNLDLQSSWNPLFQAMYAAAMSNTSGDIEKYNDLISFLTKSGAVWPQDPQNQQAIWFSQTAMRSKNLDLIFLMTGLCDCLEHSSIILPNGEYGRVSGGPQVYFLTLLQFAVLENRLEDAKKLLAHGANPNNIGSGNVFIRVGQQHALFPKSNLSIAIQNKNPEMVNLLLEHGAIIQP